MEFDFIFLVFQDDEGRLVNPTLTSREDTGKGKVGEKRATTLLLKQSTCISTPEGESFHTYWDRVVELLDACPDHGHDVLLLMDFFYSRMTPSMKRLIYTLSRGDFLDKTFEEEAKFLVETSELT